MSSSCPRFIAHSRLGTYIVFCAGMVLTASPGCNEHLLQTASETEGFVAATGGSQNLGGANGALISCENTITGEISFADVPGAEDELTESPFLSSTYGPLEGPGLYVASRDAFRVYFNGKLIAESSSSREAQFLPLSLPPGDNVLALAVSAESGPPAALIHLSELETEYGSDGTFRVSTDPAEGWMNPDFDDASFDSATELGDQGEVPGCEPEIPFPSGSDARWIGAGANAEGTMVLRRTFRIAPTGFGESTTGGNGAEPVVVTNFEQLEAALDGAEPALVLLPEGQYDFRTEPRDQEVCPIECADEPGKIQNQILIEGVCADPTITVQRYDRKLNLDSNKTLMGVGRGAALRGVTVDFQGSENLIVRNVALYDVNPHLKEGGDAFSLAQPNRVWIDHGTVKWVSDGFTDAREGTSNVTLSYMRYDGEMQEACGSRHGLPSEMTDATVTLHHSRFVNFNTRAPFVTGSLARVHVFNNVYSGIGGWTVGSRCSAQVLLQGNTFENVDAATYRSECDMPPDLGRINAPSGSNVYRDESNVHLGPDATEPQDDVFEPPYEYELSTATDALGVVTSRAGTGAVWALPLVRD